MTIPLGEKVEMLRKFHTNLHDPDWHYLESNEKDKAVLEEFPKVSYYILASIHGACILVPVEQ